VLPAKLIVLVFPHFSLFNMMSYMLDKAGFC